MVVGGGAPQNTQKDDFLYLVAVKISSVASASSGRAEKSERETPEEEACLEPARTKIAKARKLVG